MSSFGFLNITGVDGSTSGAAGASLPGGINQSVQFNDGGINFGGTSNFLYNSTTQQLSLNRLKPTVIVDGSSSVGTAGQLLSSTGSALQYITPTVVGPGAPVDSVQFNNAGVFTGDASFNFDTASQRLVVNQVKPTVIVDGSNSVGTAGQLLSSTGSALQYITPTVVGPGAPVDSVQFNNAGVFTGNAGMTFLNASQTLAVSKLFVGGTTAITGKMSVNSVSAAPGLWNDQWFLVGSGITSSSPAIGLGYNTAGNKTLAISAAPGLAYLRHEQWALDSLFYANGALRATINANGASIVGSMKSTTILDTANSPGAAGQVLSSTGSALQYINMPLSRRGQFNRASTQLLVAGSTDLIVTSQTFNIGVQLQFAPPIQSIIVTTSGIYLVTIDLTLYGTVAANVQVSTTLRQVFPLVYYESRTANVVLSEFTSISNSFMQQLNVGFVYAVSVTTNNNVTITNCNVLFQSMN